MNDDERMTYFCAFWFAYGNERNVGRADRFAQWFVSLGRPHTGIESAYTEYIGI